MTESGQPHDGDLEYDLAHEDAMTSPQPRAAAEPVVVVIGTEDHGEDYSYDLAHDVPPQESRRRQ
ncbi:MAG TPA: hypothetical protein VHO01_10285 [Jatrophihabitans sp.]|nr:hypothetical protein [Jatrophihabitans sp.]